MKFLLLAATVALAAAKADPWVYSTGLVGAPVAYAGLHAPLTYGLPYAPVVYTAAAGCQNDAGAVVPFARGGGGCLGVLPHPRLLARRLGAPRLQLRSLRLRPPLRLLRPGPPLRLLRQEGGRGRARGRRQPRGRGRSLPAVRRLRPRAVRRILRLRLPRVRRLARAGVRPRGLQELPRGAGALRWQIGNTGYMLMTISK